MPVRGVNALEGQERKDESRRIFSISSEFSDVNEILNSIPRSSRSRYICEAIKEKFERESNPNSIENQIRAMLTHMIHAEQYANQIQQSIAYKGENPQTQSQLFPFFHQMLSSMSLLGSVQMPENIVLTQVETEEKTETNKQKNLHELKSAINDSTEPHSSQDYKAEDTQSDTDSSENQPQNRGSRKIKRKLIETSLGY